VNGKLVVDTAGAVMGVEIVEPMAWWRIFTGAG
jgi:hypothetical protein